MPFGFFKSWFQKFEPCVIHDEVLGEVKSMRSGTWVTTIRLPKVEDPIPVELCDTKETPGESTLLFVREIQTEFPKVWDRLGKTLFEDVDAFGEVMSMEEFFDSFIVERITILNSACPFEWEIAASSSHEDHLFTIHMTDFENHGFSVDG